MRQQKFINWLSTDTKSFFLSVFLSYYLHHSAFTKRKLPIVLNLRIFKAVVKKWRLKISWLVTLTSKLRKRYLNYFLLLCKKYLETFHITFFKQYIKIFEFVQQAGYSRIRSFWINHDVENRINRISLQTVSFVINHKNVFNFSH